MIPSMTGPATHQALETTGRDWRGDGVAVECGSWLGASAVALLTGLTAAGYDRPFYAFDRWSANRSQVEKARAAGVTISVGQDLRPLFFANVGPVYGNIIATSCELSRMEWNGPEVEILVLDAAKRGQAFENVMAQFGGWLVDRATVALLDYHYWRKLPIAIANSFRNQERWVQARADRFTWEWDIPGESGAVFRYRRVA